MKNELTRYWRYGFLLTLLLLTWGVNSLRADSLSGAEITWVKLGQDTFEITATVYRNCNGGKMVAQDIDITTSCGTKTYNTTLKGKQDITPVCKGGCTPCSSSSCALKYGFEAHQMSAIVVVSDFRQKGCCSITASMSHGPRSGSITTGARNEWLYVDAFINICVSGLQNFNWSEHNASIGCVGRDFVQNISLITDNQHDSVVYSLVPPRTSATALTSWNGGHGSNKPLTFLGFPRVDLSFPRGFRIDSFSGQLAFRPMKEQVTVFAVKAEVYKNGAWIGTTITDRIMVVIKCQNEAPAIISKSFVGGYYPSSSSLDACVGNSTCFNVWTKDKNIADTVDLSWRTNITGLSAKRLNSKGQRDSMQFCWSPGPEDMSDQPYFITITAKDNACPVVGSSTKRLRIYVKPSPVYEINHTLKDCGKVVFKAQSVNQQPVSGYLWQYQNQPHPKVSSALQDSQEISLLASGKQVVSLSAEGNNGCIFTTTDTVTLSNNFIQAIRTSDTTVCEGSTITLRAKVQYPAGPFKVKWSTNDSSTSTVSTTQVQVGLRDTLIVLQLKDTKCTKTDTIRIKVSPTPKFLIDSQSYACFGDSGRLTTFNPNRHKITTYDWYFNNGLISGSKNDSSILAIDSGTYVVKVENHIGCTYKDSTQLNIKKPIDRGDFTRKFCKGLRTALKLKPNSSGFYSWFIGTTDTTKKPSAIGLDSIVTMFSHGQIIGVLLTDTANGLTCRSLDSLKTEEVPTQNIVVTQSKDSLCQNDTLEVVSNVLGGYWLYENQVTWAHRVKFSVSTLGSHSATYFHNHNNCKYEKTVKYEVGFEPKARFAMFDSISKGALFTPAIIENRNSTLEYFWSVGSPAFLQFYGYSLPLNTNIDSIGVFDVTLTVKNPAYDCVDMLTKPILVYFSVGLSSDDIEISVFPNPTNGRIYLKTELTSPLTYTIWSNTGQLVQSGPLSADGFIQLSKATEGIYTLQVTNGKATIRQVILIQHNR